MAARRAPRNRGAPLDGGNVGGDGDNDAGGGGIGNGNGNGNGGGNGNGNGNGNANMASRMFGNNVGAADGITTYDHRASHATTESSLQWFLTAATLLVLVVGGRRYYWRHWKRQHRPS
jgi:hypothetical protein